MNKDTIKLAFAVMLVIFFAVAMSQTVEKSPSRDYELEACLQEVTPRLRAARDDWQQKALDVCMVSKRIRSSP